MTATYSSTLIPFDYNGTHVPVRIGEHGEPLWRASDVGLVLEYKGDMGQHIRRLDDDERTLISNQGSTPEWWVTESGLYNLILGSRKKEAKAFKRWVTHEVIPAIRKTGRYEHPSAALDAYPELKAMTTLIQSVAEQRLELDTLKAEQRRHDQEIIAQQAKLIEAYETSTRAESKVDRVIEEMQWVTIRQYVYMADISHQLPESLQKEYGLWLSNYCVENNIPTYEAKPLGKVWSKENQYPLAEIKATLLGWLRRRTGQIRLVEEA